MQQRLASTWLAFFVALASGLPTARAADSRPNDVEVAAKIMAGNRAMKAGNLQDALSAYQEAAALDPDNDAAVYNQGVAFYRSGELSQAAELFQRAAASENAAIATSARFNLGNTAYAQALASVEENPGRAAEGLERAIASYRQGLSLNPDDQDARTNIELAARLLQHLQSQQEEEQQRDEEQREEQQPSPESEQQEGEQEQDGGEGQESGQQPQEDQEDTNESQQGNESQESSQTDDSPDSEEASPSESDDLGNGESPENAIPPDDTDPQSEQAGQDESESPSSGSPPAMEETPDDGSDDEGDRQEEPDTGQLDQPTPDDPSEVQDPRGELAAANQDDETQEQQAGQTALDDSATMTFEEAQKMLQAIRDRNMLRRLQRQQMERTRRVPVEKDW